jgi:hypothetical protein
MSNGGFGGVHENLLQALEAKHRGQDHEDAPAPQLGE